MEEKNAAKSFQYLKDIVDINMHTLNPIAIRTEWQAFFMKLSLLTLSALVTLVIGLKIEGFSSNVALVLSAILTVLTGMDQFLKISTRDTEIGKRHIKIIRLSLDMGLYQEGNETITKDAYEEFKRRYDEILNEVIAEQKEEISMDEGSTNSATNKLE